MPPNFLVCMFPDSSIAKKFACMVIQKRLQSSRMPHGLQVKPHWVPIFCLSASIDALRSEFMDFKQSPTEHSTLEMYKSATGDDKPRPGRFWYEVGQMKL